MYNVYLWNCKYIWWNLNSLQLEFLLNITKIQNNFCLTPTLGINILVFISSNIPTRMQYHICYLKLFSKLKT